jgi:hypothetical protein
MTDAVQIQACRFGWSNMSPREGGRHCSACDRVVVDTTKLTREEFLTMRAAAPRPMCLHFACDDEGYAIFRPERRRLPVVSHAAAATLAATLVVAQGCARPTPGAPSMTPDPTVAVANPTPTPEAVQAQAQVIAQARAEAEARAQAEATARAQAEAQAQAEAARQAQLAAAAAADAGTPRAHVHVRIRPAGHRGNSSPAYDVDGGGGLGL